MKSDSKAEVPCPYTGIAYEQVPGYVPGYGCPVCKAISFNHLTVTPAQARAALSHTKPRGRKRCQSKNQNENSNKV